MNSIFADKVAKLLDKIRTVITNFRIEQLSKLSRKNIIIIGASALVLIIICGAFVFLGGEEPSNHQPEVLADVSLEDDVTVYYTIDIDGSSIVALATEEEAEKVLDNIISHYSASGSEIVDVEYHESIEIVKKENIHPQLATVEEATTMIVTGTKEPKVYTVESGDCLWDIAVKNEMSVDELIASNPDADIDHLKIGSTLNLYELKPYVHLTLKERMSTTEKIDYDVVYEETSTLYKGEIKVKTAGVYGKREVTKEIIKENGAVVSTIELASSVLSEPSPQVNLKGTKSLATLVGSGSFISPMGHMEVSSAYGSRGGRRHTGVDLRNPKGTPIYVVDDGVVTFSGYSGSYGNIVKVSHGKGLETWYAHCDKLLVSVGAAVKKGQQIATVGITGRATGYHLHFEVRKNGSPQNPMNYL